MAVLETTLSENLAQLRRYEGDSVSPAWVTSTTYAEDDKVYINGLSYNCAIAHPSSVFATELAAGNWVLYETAIEMIRAWPNIDANYSKSLINGINDSDVVTDPKASGVTFTGAFYTRKPWAEEDGERSVTIFQHLSTTTLSAEYFPYEDRSLSAYDSVKNRTQTSTREVIQNSKTAPTFAEGEDFGVISYIKNIFGRFNGTKTVVSYTGGSGSTDPGYDFTMRYTNSVFKYYTHWQYSTYNWTKAENYFVHGDTDGSGAAGSCPDAGWTKVGGHAGVRTGVQFLSNGMFVVRIVGGRDDKVAGIP